MLWRCNYFIRGGKFFRFAYFTFGTPPEQSPAYKRLMSITNDEFLSEVRAIPQKNLALETLRKLISDEISVRLRKNVVQARSFAKMLEEAVRKYQNRAIEAAEVIEELIKLAKEMREAQKRGGNLGLTDDEIAFYDALEDSANTFRHHDQLLYVRRCHGDFENRQLDYISPEPASKVEGSSVGSQIWKISSELRIQNVS